MSFGSDPVEEAGRVVSVNVSKDRGTRKAPVGRCHLTEGHGVDGDGHADDWHRQVSLLASESIEKMVVGGLDVGPGDFAENITTSGIDLVSLGVGTTLVVGGEAVLEVSQIGKVCHDRCAIYYQAGDCVMPREGIFAVVVEAGEVAVGDEVRVVRSGHGR